MTAPRRKPQPRVPSPGVPNPPSAGVPDPGDHNLGARGPNEAHERRWTSVRRVPAAVAPLWSVLLAVVVLGPALRPGQLLLRDLVTSPRSYLTDAALGLGGAAPRAVPQDGVLALLSRVVNGAVPVQVALLVALVAGGSGAALLVRRALGRVAVGAELVAATVALWNPLVAERLLQGQWSLLLGVGALPWVVLGALELRGTERSDTDWLTGAGVLIVAVVLGGITPTGALLGVVVALVIFAWPGSGRRARDVVGLVLLAALTVAPWVLAAVLTGTGTVADDAGVQAFAARAEPGLGTPGSLLGLGGIWNSEAVPGSRSSPFAVLSTLVLLGVVSVGAPAVWRSRHTVPTGPLLVLAAVGIMGPALAATGAGLDALSWVVRVVPGAGLLRDAQKWVALAVPLYGLSAGLGMAALTARLTVAPAIAMLAVVGVLPDLAWGVGGALHTVRYPPDWATVAAVLADPSSGPGDVAVLPGGSFRRFTFSGPATVLDPAARWLDREVLSTGLLAVGDSKVAGEDARASRVEAVLLAGGTARDLAAEGVGWVLLERGTPGPTGSSATLLDQLQPVVQGVDLTLYAVPDPVAVVSAAPVARAAVLTVHALPAALLLGAVGALAVSGVRNRARRPA